MLCSKKLLNKTASAFLQRFATDTLVKFQSHAHFSFFSKKQTLPMKDLVQKMNIGLKSVQDNQIEEGVTNFKHIIDEFTSIQDQSSISDKELPLLLRAHYELARVNERSDQLLDSLHHYKEALNLSKRIYPAQGLEEGDISNALGRIYTKLSKSDEAKAKAFLGSAKVIFSNLADKAQLSPHLLENDYIQSLLYGNQGQPEKALELLEWISEQPQERNQSIFPDLELVFQSIGDIYLSMNNIPKANENWDRAIEIVTAEYGVTSEKAIGLFNGIAQSFLRHGDYKEAGRYVQKSIRACQEDLRDDIQAKYAESLLMSGFVQYRDGDFSKAIANYQKGLEIMEIHKSKSPEEIWVAYLTMAEIHLAEGRLDKSESLFNKAKERAARSLGRYHPELAGYNIYFADLMKYKVKRVKEANALYSKALDMYLMSGSIQDPRIIDIYHELGPSVFDEERNLNNFFGVLQFQQQKYEESAQSFHKAIDISREGNTDRDVLCENIGLAFEKKGLVSKAAEFYEKGLELLKGINKDQGETNNRIQALQAKILKLRGTGAIEGH